MTPLCNLTASHLLKLEYPQGSEDPAKSICNGTIVIHSPNDFFWCHLVLKIHEIHHYLQILVLKRSGKIFHWIKITKTHFKGLQSIEGYFGLQFSQNLKITMSCRVKVPIALSILAKTSLTCHSPLCWELKLCEKFGEIFAFKLWLSSQSSMAWAMGLRFPGFQF